MSDAAVKTDDKNIDKGIEYGAAKLTPERIEKTIRSVIDAETGARLKAYVETCAHCGMCSDACHIYLSRDRDPQG